MKARLLFPYNPICCFNEHHEKVYAEQVVMYCSTNEIVSKVSFRDFKFRFEKF